jgi:acyl-CoA thioesterase I
MTVLLGRSSVFAYAIHLGLALAICCFSSHFAPGPVAAQSNASMDKKVILVLGDSLAAGYGLDPSEAFPALLQEKIDAQGWPYKVVNAGLSGDTTAGGLRRLDWLLKQRVDVLIVELGGNDGLRGLNPENTRKNIQAIIDRTKAKYPDVQVVIAGMRMPPNYGPEYVEQFQSLFPALAKANQAALVPFLLEGVGGERSLNQGDRIHPTAAGQRMVAQNVWKVLRPLIQPSATVETQTTGG